MLLMLRPTLPSIALVAGVLLLGACSSPAPSTGAQAEVTESPRSHEGSGSGAEGAKKKAKGSQGGDGDPEEGQADGATDPQGDTETAAEATGVSRARDLAGDTENSGRSPGYVDARAASITDLGRAARLRLVVEGPFEDPIEDRGTYVYIGFEIERRDRRFSVSAEGDHNGWVKSVNGRDFDGDLRIEEATMTFVVPWKVIGSKEPFEWYVDTSWTYSDLTRTDYSFDRLPEYTAQYPEPS